MNDVLVSGELGGSKAVGPRLPKGELVVEAPVQTPQHKSIKDFAGVCGHNLKHGFDSVGIRLERTRLLNHASPYASPVHFIFHAGSSTRHVFYDWANKESKIDWGTANREKDILFKTQYANRVCRDFPNVLPVPLGVGQPYDLIDEVGITYLRAKRREAWESDRWRFDIFGVLEATGYRVRKELLENLLPLKESSNCLMGMTPHPKRPPVPEPILRKSAMPYPFYWYRMAESKISLSARGAGGFWDRGFCEGMAIGCTLLREAPFGYSFAGMGDSGLLWLPYDPRWTPGKKVVELFGFGVYGAREMAEEALGKSGQVVRRVIELNAMAYWENYASPAGIVTYMFQEAFR